MKSIALIVIIVVFSVLEILGTLFLLKFKSKDTQGPLVFGYFDPLTNQWMPCRREDDKNASSD
jgi:hypothetical protein